MTRRTLIAIAFASALLGGCETLDIYLDAIMPSREELNQLRAEYALDTLCDMPLDGRARSFEPKQVAHIDALCPGE